MNLVSTKTRTLFAAALFVAAAAPLTVVAQDLPAGAWAGTWIANDAKSKFPGPPPKLDQVTIQSDGTVAVHVVNSDGKVSDWSYKPQAGKAVSVTGRDGVTIKVVKVSDYRNDHIWTKEGKITRTHSTISKDGKTQTFFGAPGTYQAPGETKPKPFSEVVVYEKQ